MSSAAGDRISVKCACGATLRVPAAAAGRRGKCPKCGASLVVPGHARESAPPSVAEAPAVGAVPGGDHEPSAEVTFRCACGAKLAAPRTAAGRKVRCPQCRNVAIVPVGTAPRHGAAAPHSAVDDVAGGSDALLDELSQHERSAAAVAAPAPVPTATAPAAPGRATAPRGGAAPCGISASPASPPASIAGRDAAPVQICPSCGQAWPAGAKICVQCGVYIKTGRALMTTQDENLDRIYATTESVIRVLSFIIPFGLYPIASEAFGLCKPYVVRGIALLTILVSVWFWAYEWTDSPKMESYRNLMLWAGNADMAALIRENAEEFGLDAKKVTDRQIAAIEHEVFGEYRPSQLITHAFLHAGILHLAGNLLFLMVFGSRVNALIGSFLTFVLYFVFAIASGLAYRASAVGELPHPLVGASGAIMGMAGMYIILFPAHRVHMAIWIRWGLFLGLRLSSKLFAVRGFWVVLFYIAFDVIYTAFGLKDNVAHWAHLGGFLTGIAAALALLGGRVICGRGGDLVTKVLGRHAWALVGKPNRPSNLITRY